jgi:hypothetical protein
MSWHLATANPQTPNASCVLSVPGRCPPPDIYKNAVEFTGWTGTLLGTTDGLADVLLISAWLPNGAALYAGSGADQDVHNNVPAKTFLDWFNAQPRDAQRRALQLPYIRDIRLKSAKAGSRLASETSLFEDPHPETTPLTQQFALERISVLVLPRPRIVKRGQQFDFTVSPGPHGPDKPVAHANGFQRTRFEPLVALIGTTGRVAALSPAVLGSADPEVALHAADALDLQAASALLAVETVERTPHVPNDPKPKDDEPSWWEWCSVL